MSAPPDRFFVSFEAMSKEKMLINIPINLISNNFFVVMKIEFKFTSSFFSVKKMKQKKTGPGQRF